jgi:hypothetical protein
MNTEKWKDELDSLIEIVPDFARSRVKTNVRKMVRLCSISGLAIERIIQRRRRAPSLEAGEWSILTTCD